MCTEYLGVGAAVVGGQQPLLHPRPDSLNELLLVKKPNFLLGGVHIHVHVRPRQLHVLQEGG